MQERSIRRSLTAVAERGERSETERQYHSHPCRVCHERIPCADRGCPLGMQERTANVTCLDCYMAEYRAEKTRKGRVAC